MYELQLGVVLGVTQSKDSSDTYHPTIQVRSFLDSATIEIPLAPAAWEQSLPIEGYIVCFIRQGNFQARILKIWGKDESFTRIGPEFGLFPGEVFIQSPSGLGYLKIDNTGRVYLNNGDQTSSLQMTENGIGLSTNRLYIDTIRGQVMEFGTDGSMSLTKVDPANGTVSGSVTILSDGGVRLTSVKDVTIKAPNIYLDGNVWAGQNASDASARAAFGEVLTTGPQGTLPFDHFTGKPLTGVPSVRLG